MILVDYSQVVMANLMQQINISHNENLEENFLRHMILNSIRSINSKFRNEFGELIICSDHPPYWRKAVFPNYKQNRQKHREDSIYDWSVIFDSINIIKEEIKSTFPFKFIDIKSAEADDIIATLAAYRQDKPVLIVSGDKDFIQLQKYPNVKQYSPVLKKFITEEFPEKYLMNKVLTGDSGDGIPNYLSDDDTFVVQGKRQKRISHKKIDKLVESTDIVSELSAEEVKNFFRNKELIDFFYIPQDIKEEILRQYEAYNEHTISDVYVYLQEKKLRSLLTQIGDFL